MSTLTDKLPTFDTTKLPTIDLTEAKKPLFAALGVADLALEQVKEVPADLSAEAKKVQTRVENVPAKLKGLPTQVKELRTSAEAKISTAQGTATDFYAKLAVRGERLVSQIRRQPATEAAIAEGKAAVKKAEAATVAAKKSVKAGGKAVEGAAAKIG
jgi:peptidoglycan hydrolase CwlO-like protein